MNIAKYEKRVGAYVVNLLFAGLFPTSALILCFIQIPNFFEIPFIFLFLMFMAACWVVYTFIFSLWLFVSNGRTLGHLIFGLRVIHSDIARLRYGNCLARAAAEGMPLFALISAIFVVVRKTEKSAFDRLTATLVVDWRNRTIS